MGKWNKINISMDDLKDLEADKDEEELTICQIFTSRVLFIRSVVIFINW